MARKEPDEEVARDRVVLKKVETRRQEVNLSSEEIDLMRQFERDVNPKTELTSDEITMIGILEKQKLFMERIMIKANQARAALGMPLFRSPELSALLESLMAKGLASSRVAPNGDPVYYLTDAGLDFLDIA